jgi:predicted outer membrane repeat protein
MLGGPAAGLDFALGGGALVAYMNGYLNVTSSEFFNNVAQNGPGGAILNGDAAGNNLFGLGVDAFVVSTSVTHCSFGGNQALSGNGGAIASQSDSVFCPPGRTIASTALSVADSLFVGNSATGDGGALYLNDSTSTLHDNLYQSNHAVMGNSILATMSIVNGSSIPISQ